jgi:excinuclease ABC subunit A
MEMILNGGRKNLPFLLKQLGVAKEYKIEFEGISHFIKIKFDESGSAPIKRWSQDFMDEVKCPVVKAPRHKRGFVF